MINYIITLKVFLCPFSMLTKTKTNFNNLFLEINLIMQSLTKTTLPVGTMVLYSVVLVN